MTFAEVLPALLAGRIAGSGRVEYRWHKNELQAHFGTSGWCKSDNSTSDLLASDWELVEEPAPEVVNWERMYRNQYELTKKICDERDAHGREYRATIARLERELAEAKRKQCCGHFCGKLEA